MRQNFTLVFLLLSFSLSAQNAVIQGKIQRIGNQAISDVIVRVANSEIAGITDEEGKFELKNVPYGIQEIHVSSLEIESQKQTLEVKSPKHVLNFTIKLKDGIALRELEVIKKTEKTKIETQGFAVNVIETKDVATRNFQTNELLDRTAGVRVRQNGGMGSAVNYNLNGMSGGSVRILINGTPISTYGSSFSLNSIPPALIERIEVYKGVIPAHLSDDALGGAINVILKKDFENTLSASVSYGSFNTQQAFLNGLYRNKNNGLTVKASAFYNYSDNNYEVWGKFVRNILPNGRYEYIRAKRFNDAYKSYGTRFEVGFSDVKWADEAFIGFNLSDSYNEIQHGVYMSIPYMGRFTESNAKVLNLNYRKTDFITKGLAFTFDGSQSTRKTIVSDTVKWNYNWYGEKSLGLNGDPILRPSGAQQGAPTLNHINRKINTFRTGLTYDFIPNNRIILNHVYYKINRTEQDFMKSAIERKFIGTRSLHKNISSLAYEALAFDTNLMLTVFGKYYQQKTFKMDPLLTPVDGQLMQTQANNKKTFGYGYALSYKIARRITLQNSVEKAVRMPSENEIFGSPGENIVENFGIRPEVSNNLNLGIRLGPFSNQNHKYAFGATGFIRDTKDKIVRRINPRLNDAVQTDPFENLGKTMSIGFETEASYSLKNNLKIGLNLSKFNSVFNTRFDPNGAEYPNYKKQLPNEPFFTLNANSQYSLKDILKDKSDLTVYYSFGFVEKFNTTWLDIEDFKTPRQYIQDFGLSYAFPNRKFVVSGDIKNIFDKQAYDNFAVQKPGRAFYLKLNYTINKS